MKSWLNSCLFTVIKVARIYCEIVILLVERISLLGADPLNYEILRGVYPELAEGLRMTVAGIRLVVGQPL